MFKNYVVMLAYGDNTTNEWMSFNTLSAAQEFKRFVNSEAYMQDFHVSDIKLFEVKRDAITNNLILHEIV